MLLPQSRQSYLSCQSCTCWQLADDPSLRRRQVRLLHRGAVRLPFFRPKLCVQGCFTPILPSRLETCTPARANPGCSGETLMLANHHKGLGLVVVSLGIVVCNAPVKTNGSGGAGGQSAEASSSSSSSFGGSLIIPDAGDPSGPFPLADAGIPEDAASPPTDMPCDVDASDPCPLPPSVCYDSQWLIFYTNPTCMEGVCHFDALAMSCGNAEECINGGCEYNFTK